MTMFDRVKEISKKRGLSLSQLNDKVGFKQNVIYSWKTKTPSVDKVKAVADVLNVSVDYLLGRDQEEDDPISFYRIDTDGLDSAEIDNVKDQLDTYTEFLKEQIIKNRNKKS